MNQSEKEAFNRKRRQVYKRFVESEDGKFILQDLERQFRMASPCFITHEDDGKCCPYVAAQNDGQKAVFHYIKFHGNQPNDDN